MILDNGRPVAAEADGTASPYGAYMCPKGLTSIDFHNGDENRLVTSFKRDDAGEFQPIAAPRALDEVAAQLSELQAVLAEEPATRFPYLLTCRRILEAMNSAYRDAGRMRRKYPVNWAWMNPNDMAEAGIAEEGEIESEAGRIRGMARAEDRLRRGVISMTHMFGELAPSRDPEQAGAVLPAGSPPWWIGWSRSITCPDSPAFPSG